MPVRGVPDIVDVFVVGGGINGVAIARDAVGRGLSVRLAEMGDLGGKTSSSSTKLFHGGLRYLEYFEFGLVRHALAERETLLRAMPHISWPLRFVLPCHDDMRFDAATPASRLLGHLMPWLKGRRPRWMIRFGLFLYDNLGKRSVLPGTQTLNLVYAVEGKPLKEKFTRAFEYSDCWVDDSRLVSLTARDAAERGAEILTRQRMTRAERKGDLWDVLCEDVRTGEHQSCRARVLVNAGGPWVEDILKSSAGVGSPESVRLVRGSHIVTRKLFDHDKCYFFQGSDGRIIFAIPYENDFTLIGTTDEEHSGDPAVARASDEEQEYLCAFASEYFEQPVTRNDIVWTYSGVRPLYDDGTKSATAATRDYVLSIDETSAPVLSVFGGKITTHRRLAEEALDRIARFLPNAKEAWTAGVPLPGGDFPVHGSAILVEELHARFEFLDQWTAKRLVRAYGAEAVSVLGNACKSHDLGREFGAGLTEREVRWLVEREFAETAEDVLWRRSKIGLRLTAAEVDALDAWMNENTREGAMLRAAE